MHVQLLDGSIITIRLLDSFDYLTLEDDDTTGNSNDNNSLLTVKPWTPESLRFTLHLTTYVV